MEPARPAEYHVPVYHSGTYLGHGGMRPVIYHLACTCDRPGLKIEDTDPVPSVDYAGSIHPVSAKVGYA